MSGYPPRGRSKSRTRQNPFDGQGVTTFPPLPPKNSAERTGANRHRQMLNAYDSQRAAGRAGEAHSQLEIQPPANQQQSRNNHHQAPASNESAGRIGPVPKDPRSQRNSNTPYHPQNRPLHIMRRYSPVSASEMEQRERQTKVASTTPPIPLNQIRLARTEVNISAEKRPGTDALRVDTENLDFSGTFSPTNAVSPSLLSSPPIVTPANVTAEPMPPAPAPVVVNDVLDQQRGLGQTVVEQFGRLTEMMTETRNTQNYFDAFAYYLEKKIDEKKRLEANYYRN